MLSHNFEPSCPEDLSERRLRGSCRCWMSPKLHGIPNQVSHPSLADYQQIQPRLPVMPMAFGLLTLAFRVILHLRES